VLNISAQERSRIGQDLHDSVGQAMAGVGYLVGAVQQRLSRKGVAEAVELERVGELIEKSVLQVRAMAHSLYPDEVKEGGLVGALRELALSTQTVFGIACHVSSPRDFPIEEKVMSNQLYRIAQEAVNNAVRHSRTKMIRIELFKKQKKLMMVIADTGIGLTSPKGNRTGMGKRIMNYRAEVIGATLTIVSVRNKGTTVTCVCPFSKGSTGKTTR